MLNFKIETESTKPYSYRITCALCENVTVFLAFYIVLHRMQLLEHC